MRQAARAARVQPQTNRRPATRAPIELLLQPLVGVVDRELLERVDLEVFKAKDVEDSNERFRGLLVNQHAVAADHQPRKQLPIDGLCQRCSTQRARWLNPTGQARNSTRNAQSHARGRSGHHQPARTTRVATTRAREGRRAFARIVGFLERERHGDLVVAGDEAPRAKRIAQILGLLGPEEAGDLRRGSPECGLRGYVRCAGVASSTDSCHGAHEEAGAEST